MAELNRRSFLTTGGAVVAAGFLEGLTETDLGQAADTDLNWIEDAIAYSNELVNEFAIFKPKEIASEPENERIGWVDPPNIAETFIELGFHRVDEVFSAPPEDPSAAIVTGECDPDAFISNFDEVGRHLGTQGDFQLYEGESNIAVGVSDHAAVFKEGNWSTDPIEGIQAFLTSSEHLRTRTTPNPLRDLANALPSRYDTFFGGADKRAEVSSTLNVDSDLLVAGAATIRTEDGWLISDTGAVFESESDIDLEFIRNNNRYAGDHSDRPYSVSQEGRVVIVQHRVDLSIFSDDLLDELFPDGDG